MAMAKAGEMAAGMAGATAEVTATPAVLAGATVEAVLAEGKVAAEVVGGVMEQISTWSRRWEASAQML